MDGGSSKGRDELVLYSANSPINLIDPTGFYPEVYGGDEEQRKLIEKLIDILGHMAWSNRYKQSGKIYKELAKIAGKTNFKITPLPFGWDAYVNPITGTIYINPNLLKYQTDDEIFATILHELMHKYLRPSGIGGQIVFHMIDEELEERWRRDFKDYLNYIKKHPLHPELGY